MTDPVEITALVKLLADGGPLLLHEKPIDLLRAARECMVALLPQLSDLVKTADEADLAAARARVAEIEARLNILPNPIRPPSKPALVSESDYDQTDAGMGIGARREPVNGQSAEDFQDELHELRQRGAAKRGRRA